MLYYSLFIVIMCLIHHFVSFYNIVVSKCEEWKMEAFYGGLRETLTSLRHYGRACGGYKYCLTGSKGKPTS